MKDFKTTVASIVQAITLVTGLVGIKVAPDASEAVITATVSVYAVINIIKGYFTKDATPTPEK